VHISLILIVIVPNVLYRNNAVWTTVGDYDGDGYLDIYVTNFRQTNMLYHNNHDESFTDVTIRAGVGRS